MKKKLIKSKSINYISDLSNKTKNAQKSLKKKLKRIRKRKKKKNYFQENMFFLKF